VIWTSAVVLYVVIWFLTLFVVLPIGYQSQEEEDGEVVPGTPPGAPSSTHFKRKFLWTTVAGTLVWGVVMAIILTGVIPLEVFDIITPDR
jgi:predicted secreted protein